MRILAIGDIHGKTIWKQAVEKISADITVFIGDYVIVKRWLFNKHFRENLESLIRYKRGNFGGIYLLLGNHDIPYIYGHSRAREMLCPKLCRLYQDNWDCFQVAYQHHQYLFTHAGLSKGWYETHSAFIDSFAGNTLADKLNSIHQSPQYKLLHERGKARGGSFEFGGITYADKVETELSGLDGYIQVVGHTKVPQPVRMNFRTGSMIYIDCLNTVDNFLYIDDDKTGVVTVNGEQRNLSTNAVRKTADHKDRHDSAGHT